MDESQMLEQVALKQQRVECKERHRKRSGIGSTNEEAKRRQTRGDRDVDWAISLDMWMGQLVWLWSIPIAIFGLLLLGCDGEEADETVIIELADFNEDELIDNPFGGGRMVSGRVLIDFVDDLGLEEIDSILSTHDLQRIGTIGGFNLITARIIDDRSETQVQTELETLPEIDVVALVFEVLPLATSGTVPPIPFPSGAVPAETLNDAELFINWPHYMMDTLPAHALADSVLGTSEPADVVVAIMDTGSFHDQSIASGSAANDRSILTDESGDTDLGPRVVQPTGIEIDGATGVGQIVVGSRTVADNRLINAGGGSLHGLKVASAAVASGQDIRGTGRHARFRPILISRTFVQGVCTNDRSITCVDTCPEGAGTCDTGISVIDYLLGAVTMLAQNLSAPEAAQTRIVNISLGFEIDDEAQRDRVRRIFRAPFESLLQGNRVLVVAAGNDSADTNERIFSVLAPTRGVDRASTTSPIDQKMVVVSGTAMPEGNEFLLLLDNIDTTSLEFEGRSERAYRDTNWGAQVHVSAPGEYVPVMAANLRERRVSDGTSFSAPYVAGLLAEMFALDGAADARELIEIAETTADDLGDSGPDDIFGHGRINAWKALLTLLNRHADPAAPEWLGLRVHYALELAPDAQIAVNGSPVTDVVWRRVPADASGNDNSGELPSAGALPAALAADISMSADEFAAGEGGIGMIEVRSPSGSPIYQLPVRESDLLGGRVLGTTVDDYVIRIEVTMESGAIWGRVVDEEGEPVPGASISYPTVFGVSGEATADENGYYTAYDAAPDSTIDIVASADNMVGDVHTISVPSLQAVRQDFMLTVGTSPECDEDGTCDPSEICDTCRIDCAEPAGDCAWSERNQCGTCFDTPSCPETFVAYEEDPPWVLIGEHWSGAQIGSSLYWYCEYESGLGGSWVDFVLRWIETSQAEPSCTPLCDPTTYTSGTGEVVTIAINSESTRACVSVASNTSRAAGFDNLLGTLNSLLPVAESRGLPCE